jgi:hypothetical protein
MAPPVTVTLTNTGNVAASWQVSIRAGETVPDATLNNYIPWATLSSAGGSLGPNGGHAQFVITPTGAPDTNNVGWGVCINAPPPPDVWHADVTVTGKTITYKTSTTITYTIAGDNLP